MQEKIDILSEKLERESYVGDKQNLDYIEIETSGKNSKVKCKFYVTIFGKILLNNRSLLYNCM